MSLPEPDSTPHAKLRELIVSAWKTQAIRVAAELELADLLAAQPHTADDLAKVTGTNPSALRQLLRALCSLDLCAEVDSGKFALTETGALLSKNSPRSLHQWATWFGSHGWPLYAELTHSVKTGNSARSLLRGTRGFEHLEQDSAEADTFHRALVELTQLTSDDIARSYDFSGVAQLVDVGGGHGELIRAILAANPSLQGTVFERPHAIQGAQAHLERSGVINRCSFETGDFFTALPVGADAYVLKSVLHDWDDRDCVRILKCCATAMVPKARLLIIEQLMPARIQPSAGHRALCAGDLHMLVAHGSHERDQPEFTRLLETAGFKLVRVIETLTQFSVIEAQLAV